MPSLVLVNKNSPGFYARRRTMFLPRLTAFIRMLPLYLAAAIFAGTVSVALWAQTSIAQTSIAPSPSSTPPIAPQPARPHAINLKDYSKPRSAFPRVLQPYMPQEVAQPNLGNSSRIDSLMKDGKIYLSIDDRS